MEQLQTNASLLWEMWQPQGGSTAQQGTTLASWQSELIWVPPAPFSISLQCVSEEP